MTANSLINVLIKQSLKTFRVRNFNSEIFTNNLQKLKTIMNNLTTEDVNFNTKFEDPEMWEKPGKAPMTYIQIYGDQDINVGIFILKPGMKLPLHDHPHMHGLLKVILGKVKIENYSIKPELTEKFTSPRELDGTDRIELVAKQHDHIIADASSDCCVVQPLERNLHEIQSIEGTSAFLDVLSPPYDAYISEFGYRKCSYYSRYKELEPGIFHLIEIQSPHWFWSDDAPYEGPDLLIDEQKSDESVRN